MERTVWKNMGFLAVTPSSPQVCRLKIKGGLVGIIQYTVLRTIKLCRMQKQQEC